MKKIIAILSVLLLLAGISAGAEESDLFTGGTENLPNETTAEGLSITSGEPTETKATEVIASEQHDPEENTVTAISASDNAFVPEEISQQAETPDTTIEVIPAEQETPVETGIPVDNKPADSEAASTETATSPAEMNDQEEVVMVPAEEPAPPADAPAAEEPAAPADAPTPEEPAAPADAPTPEEPAAQADVPAPGESSTVAVITVKEDTAAPTDLLTATETSADILPVADYSSENSVRGFIYRLYSTVFQREPDAGGLNFWVEQLEAGTNTAAGAVSFFFNSREYQSSGKTNNEIVNDCYHTMMNRDPEDGGYKYWKQRLDVGMTPQVVLAGFVYSDEFARIINRYGVTRGNIELTNPRDKNYERTYFVYRLFLNCLGREADLAGEEYWCDQLEKGRTGVEVASGFFFSDEFNKNRYNNSTFVQLLYKAIQGREYDTSGLIHWTNRLNLFDTREKVLNGFALSPEFQEQCRVAQISAGDPLATPDDTFEWQYNIRVLQLCNNERRKAGLGDLYTREDLLWDLAMLRANETTERWSHTRPNGASCFELFREQGFNGYLGENIAAGMIYKDPAKVVEDWMNSPGHRANILNTNYTYLATGYVYAPDAYTYCDEGKYAGQRVRFGVYCSQAFCNYGSKIK